jgi:hypothetical protein
LAYGSSKTSVRNELVAAEPLAALRPGITRRASECVARHLQLADHREGIGELEPLVEALTLARLGVGHPDGSPSSIHSVTSVSFVPL